MNVVYRILAAVLAIVSGVVIAALIVALTNDTEDNELWFVVFGAAAVFAVGAAVVLWSKAAGR